MNQIPFHFGKFWTTPWPYQETSAGVGIKMTGYPTNPEEFTQILQTHSCNPIAVKRILKALKEDGVKLSTISYSIPLGIVGEAIEKLGVTLEIIAPCDEKIDTTVEDTKALIEAIKSGEIDESTLGPYGHVAHWKF